LPQPTLFQLGVKCLAVTWFGGLQLLVPVIRNQIKTSSDFGIGNFEEPDPILGFWFYLWVELEPEHLENKRFLKKRLEQRLNKG
jgi:hypothetical protein